MIIKDGDCTKCPHWVRWDEKSEDRVCEFDGECENFIVEQTNEEWIKQASTEELAELIRKLVWCSTEIWQRFCTESEDEETDIGIVLEWLKEKHDESYYSKKM